MPTMITDRTYPSTKRGSTNEYTIKQWDDGTFSCNCPGWRFKREGKPRTCAHETWFMKGYYFLTFAEATRAAMRGEQWDKIETIGERGFIVQFIKRVGQDVRPVPKPDRVRVPDPIDARDYFPVRNSPDPDVLTQEEMRLAEAGKMISAIKSYRARTYADLVTAKRMLEGYLSKKGYRTPPMPVGAERATTPAPPSPDALPKPKPFRLNTDRAPVAFDEEV